MNANPCEQVFARLLDAREVATLWAYTRQRCSEWLEPANFRV